MPRMIVIVMVFIIVVVLACSLFLVAYYIQPRLWAYQHTEELCSALKAYYSVESYARATGDTSHLGEVLVADLAKSGSEFIEGMYASGIVHTFETEIVACRAVYYTPDRAEIEATERMKMMTLNKQTGEVISPDPKYTQLDAVRESTGKTTFVKENGLWKVKEGKEYEWHNVLVK